MARRGPLRGAAIGVPRRAPLVPSLQLLELSLAYTDRLAELGIAPSVGSRGDCYDNALAESVMPYKTELIDRAKP